MTIGSLLGQWHQWRAHYTPERSYARVRFAYADGADEDEELEALQMRSIEEAVAGLTQLEQLAIQHVARAECMGVEVIRVTRLPHDRAQRELICERAVARLQRRLIALGVL